MKKESLFKKKMRERRERQEKLKGLAQPDTFKVDTGKRGVRAKVEKDSGIDKQNLKAINQLDTDTLNSYIKTVDKNYSDKEKRAIQTMTTAIDDRTTHNTLNGSVKKDKISCLYFTFDGCNISEDTPNKQSIKMEELLESFKSSYSDKRKFSLEIFVTILKNYFKAGERHKLNSVIDKRIKSDYVLPIELLNYLNDNSIPDVFMAIYEFDQKRESVINDILFICSWILEVSVLTVFMFINKNKTLYQDCMCILYGEKWREELLVYIKNKLNPLIARVTEIAKYHSNLASLAYFNEIQMIVSFVSSTLSDKTDKNLPMIPDTEIHHIANEYEKSIDNSLLLRFLKGREQLLLYRDVRSLPEFLLLFAYKEKTSEQIDLFIKLKTELISELRFSNENIQKQRVFFINLLLRLEREVVNNFISLENMTKQDSEILLWMVSEKDTYTRLKQRCIDKDETVNTDDLSEKSFDTLLSLSDEFTEQTLSNYLNKAKELVSTTLRPEIVFLEFIRMISLYCYVSNDELLFNSQFEAYVTTVLQKSLSNKETVNFIIQFFNTHQEIVQLLPNNYEYCSFNNLVFTSVFPVFLLTGLDNVYLDTLTEFCENYISNLKTTPIYGDNQLYHHTLDKSSESYPNLIKLRNLVNISIPDSPLSTLLANCLIKSSN